MNYTEEQNEPSQVIHCHEKHWLD